MRLWNIGAEGQFVMGAFGASAIILAPVLPAETSRWIFIPVMILAGMAAGAAWGFIPGYLKAVFNVNEIISSLIELSRWHGQSGSLQCGPRGDSR
jgi:simple sugar transport system permease protein